ncbi:MAG: D-alanyl-D-alanine carboxypeptidase [Erysipelotrichaceae bacterium]|nr:D-alanyl-D-alanine carboxypeptidase [Erysipelotrichaceae bacterium]
MQLIYGEDLAANAQSCILIEATTKQVLYKNNETEKLYPASTTKIMTMILMFEAINKGTLSWDEMLTCSEYAASMGGSQIYLEQGETMSVSDLFKSIAIASANDSCVMIGERIGGSIEGFVDMMNEKAKELNLTNTHFENATGLHDDNHYTCALDLSTMAAYLIEIGGDTLFATTSLYDSYIREDSDSKFWLVNTNKLLNSYEGCDGLKTGYTKEAGYCIVSTAKRNGLRLIGVVLKESDPKIRNSEVAALLDYGFSLYESVTLFKKDEVIENVDIKNATVSSVDIVALNDITYIKNKNNTSEITYNLEYTNLNPPLNQGDVVGYLIIMQDNESIGSYELSVKEDVEALSLIEKAYENLLDFL